MQLKDYQIEGIKFLKRRKYALLGDDPGLGKTAQAILGLDARDVALIVCPAPVKDQWAREIRKWLPDARIQVIYTSKDTIISGQEFYIINYDLLIRRPIFKTLRQFPYFTAVICDEAHRLKNSDAKRTKHVLNKHGLFGKGTKMWFLTGTPIKGRPMDLFPILSTCAPELIKPYDTYLKFAYRYCGAYIGNFGLDVSGATNIEELRKRIAPFMLRRRKRDVQKELPPRMLEIITLKQTPEIKARVKEIEEETLDRAEKAEQARKGGRAITVDDFALSEISRLRLAMAQFKIGPVVEYVRDLLASQEKVVIFYHHTEIRQELIRKLKEFEGVTISGDDNPRMRPMKVDLFLNDPKYRILFGQIQACGEGVDGLQHGCSTCVFIEPSWSPTDIDQCISRLDRMGQTEMVNAYIFIYDGTIEASMIRTMEWKQNVIDELIEGNTEKTPTKKQEEQMYVEQRLEKLEEIVTNLAQSVATMAQLIAAGNYKEALDKGAVNTPTPAAEPAPKKTKATAKKQPEPEAEPEAKAKKAEPKEEVTEETLRALAVDICRKWPQDSEGKKKVQTVVAKFGGEKIADLPPEALEPCFEEMLKVFNGK